MKKALVCLIAITALFAGCSKSSAPKAADTSSASAPPIITPSISPLPTVDLCGDMGDLRSLVISMQKGTVTPDEVIAGLDDAEATFEQDEKDARTLGDSELQAAAKHVAIAAGQLKVSINAAGTLFESSPEVVHDIINLAHTITASAKAC